MLGPFLGIKFFGKDKDGKRPGWLFSIFFAILVALVVIGALAIAEGFSPYGDNLIVHYGLIFGLIYLLAKEL